MAPKSKPSKRAVDKLVQDAVAAEKTTELSDSKDCEAGAQATRTKTRVQRLRNLAESLQELIDEEVSYAQATDVVDSKDREMGPQATRTKTGATPPVKRPKKK